MFFCISLISFKKHQKSYIIWSKTSFFDNYKKKFDLKIDYQQSRRFYSVINTMKFKRNPHTVSNTIQYGLEYVQYKDQSMFMYTYLPSLHKRTGKILLLQVRSLLFLLLSQVWNCQGCCLTFLKSTCWLLKTLGFRATFHEDLYWLPKVFQNFNSLLFSCLKTKMCVAHDTAFLGSISS